MADTDESFPTWVNGRLFAPGEGVVSALDEGFLLGLGVFDGMLFEAGHRFFERRHLDRFEQGVRSLGVEWPLPWDPALVLEEYCRALGERDAFVRLTGTRGVPGIGPTLMVSARAIERPPESGVSATLAPVNAGSICTIKSTGRSVHVFARGVALRQGAYDALFGREPGEVLEGTISNLFLVLDDVLVTPSLDRGVLPGVMRGLVIEEAETLGLEVEERRVVREDLLDASEIFLTNTSGAVIGVLEVQGLPSSDPLPGPAGLRTAALAGCIRAREQADRAMGEK